MAGSPLGPSTYCTSTLQVLRTPRAGLATRLSDFATNRHEYCDLSDGQFVHGRTIPVRQALFVALWTNLGCGLLVCAAVLPLKFLVLVLLGYSGIFVNLETPPRFRHAYGAIFGLALLRLALTMVRTTAANLVQFDWAQSTLIAMTDTAPAAFLSGLGLTVLAQSHLSVVMIAIVVTEADLFERVVWMIDRPIRATPAGARRTCLRGTTQIARVPPRHRQTELAPGKPN
jgi:hypothetical protein